MTNEYFNKGGEETGYCLLTLIFEGSVVLQLTTLVVFIFIRFCAY